MANSRTGIVYHEDMTKHFCIWDSNYPECPQRFSKILQRCNELNLVNRCRHVSPREASSTEILVKHSPQMITVLEQCENKSADELEEISSHYDSVYICPETYRLAKMATGSVINLVKEICENNIRNGMAIVRPPGHHAMESAYCGYCFFNNVALAADYALKNYDISRILIVDWDVHHGQATQQMFYHDKRVLYFSIHRYEYGTFWPNLRESDYDYIGEGEGKGYNFNVPLNKTGIGNTEYLAIFNELLLPVATEYKPDLIIVSSGYDAAIGCPEGEMKVEPACYAHFVNSLAQLADGKIAVVLEGGYFLKSLAEGAAMTLRALLGDPCPYIGPIGSPDENIRETIRNVIFSHRETWDCFKIYETFSSCQPPLPVNSHQPVVKFEYAEEPLEIFPTRGAYPLVTDEMASYFNDWLNDLIECTDLRNPEHKCVFFSKELENDIIVDYVFQNSKFTHRDGYPDFEEFFRRIKSKNVDWETCTSVGEPSSFIKDQSENNDSFLARSIFKTCNCLHKKIIGSAIIEDSEIYSDISDNIVEYYRKHNTQKLLVIDLHSGKFKPTKNTEDVLVLRISNERLKNDVEKQDKYDIRVNWNNASSVGNFEYITLWLKTVLPIGYQFGPGSILMLVDFDSWKRNQVSVELAAHLVHWLTALANGKVTVVVNEMRSEFAKLAFMYVCRALTGEKLPNIRVENFNENEVNVIKNTNEELEAKWPALNTFVKFPSGNNKNT